MLPVLTLLAGVVEQKSRRRGADDGARNNGTPQFGHVKCAPTLMYLSVFR